MPELPAWVGLLNYFFGGAALGLILWLWLTGVLKRSKDCDAEVAALKEAHQNERDLIAHANGDTLTAINLANDNRVKALTARLDAVIADRDAWREAHSEEAGARRAAETATRQLMESGNVTMGLLSALKDALAQTPPETKGGLRE